MRKEKEDGKDKSTKEEKDKWATRKGGENTRRIVSKKERRKEER
jgi:hypothetical protein